jgi:2-polyprenyl-6-methoxyphenol hydroxylase-like FAD-dependent oxidoreductase
MTEVLIAGGGIGGLTAAAALGRRGFTVHVFERAERLRADGAGITLQPNAMRVLASLGLAEPIERAGAVLAGGRLLDERGEVIQTLDLGGFEVRGVAIHRAPLLDILARESGAVVHTGRAVTGFEQEDGAVTAKLADGGTMRGAALVGCDGLRSSVRAALHGESAPRYAGYTAWRGVADFDLPDALSVELWGPGKRFGMVPIAPGRTYWFATENAPVGGKDGDAVAELVRRFAGWPDPVERLVAATPEGTILRNDLFDRPPLRPWGRGRVTLLGDAAHPMTPNLGQGACQAIEDAAVLAACLGEHPDCPPAALRRYEDLRYERTAWVTRQAWQMGRLAQGIRATPLRRLRDWALKHLGGRQARATLQRLYAAPLDVRR